MENVNIKSIVYNNIKSNGEIDKEVYICLNNLILFCYVKAKELSGGKRERLLKLTSIFESFQKQILIVEKTGKPSKNAHFDI